MGGQKKLNVVLSVVQGPSEVTKKKEQWKQEAGAQMNNHRKLLKP
jgi:hypothetical protein